MRIGNFEIISRDNRLTFKIHKDKGRSLKAKWEEISGIRARKERAKAVLLRIAEDTKRRIEGYDKRWSTPGSFVPIDTIDLMIDPIWCPVTHIDPFDSPFLTSPTASCRPDPPQRALNGKITNVES